TRSRTTSFQFGKSIMSFSQDFLAEIQKIAGALDTDATEQLGRHLGGILSQQVRLFILGVGGSDGNASHAVNDFRKITGMETYAPTDNVSELTARTNDEGRSTVLQRWAPARGLGRRA